MQPPTSYSRTHYTQQMRFNTQALQVHAPNANNFIIQNLIFFLKKKFRATFASSELVSSSVLLWGLKISSRKIASAKRLSCRSILPVWSSHFSLQICDVRYAWPAFTQRQLHSLTAFALTYSKFHLSLSLSLSLSLCIYTHLHTYTPTNLCTHTHKE